MTIDGSAEGRGAPYGDTSTDTILGGRVRLQQPRTGYRVALDPVLLAAATAAVAGERVLDVGCGSGAASLCLAVRVPGVAVVGLERYAPAAALAGANVRLNGLEERVQVVEGCLLTPPAPLSAGSFDRVMMNPPFLAGAAATLPPDPWKAAANIEGDAALNDWIAFAHRSLKAAGVLTLIHRADRVDELLAALCPLFDGTVVFPLWPGEGMPARRMLVSAVRRQPGKRGRTPARLAAGLVLHAAPEATAPGGAGPLTASARAVVEDAAALIV